MNAADEQRGMRAPLITVPLRTCLALLLLAVPNLRGAAAWGSEPGLGAELVIGTATGSAGQTSLIDLTLIRHDEPTVNLEVNLRAPQELMFGRCDVNPEINRTMQRTDGPGNEVRIILITFSEQTVLPDGVPLIQCEIGVDESAEPAFYPIEGFEIGASDSVGGAVEMWARNGGVVVGNAATPSPTATVSTRPPTPVPEGACPGDCDGNGFITTSERIRALDILHETLPLSACPTADHFGDGRVTINEHTLLARGERNRSCAEVPIASGIPPSLELGHVVAGTSNFMLPQLQTDGRELVSLQFDLDLEKPVTGGLCRSVVTVTKLVQTSLLPFGCNREAKECDKMRISLSSFPSLRRLPNQRILMRCELELLPDTAPGLYALTASNGWASTAEGSLLPLVLSPGSLIVGNAELPTPTQVRTLSPFPTVTLTPTITGTPPTKTPTPEATPTPTQLPPDTCPGDCNGDLSNSISDLLIGVNALLDDNVARCPAADGDGDGRVTVDEAVKATIGRRDGILANCPPRTPPAVAPPRVIIPIVSPPTVPLQVQLRANGNQIAAVQLDLEYSAPVTLTDCRSNVGLRKSIRIAELGDGNGWRVLVHEPTNTDAIPDRSMLFSCAAALESDAADGFYPILGTNGYASTPEGGRIPVLMSVGGLHAGSAATVTPTSENPTSTPSPAAETPGTPPCPGDCNGDGNVTIDELVLSVAIALERQPAAACVAVDTNRDRVVSISELVRAVASALAGCADSARP